MIDSANVPEVTAEESLARFITQSSQFRKGDKTVKQDAFIPHPHLDLSVTRHCDATAEEIWSIGRGIASTQNRTLYGRADIQAVECIAIRLEVKAAPVSDNPNHAIIVGWPTAKEDQKAIALKLAAAATFVAGPPTE